MAKIIPVSMSVRKFLPVRQRWGTITELSRMHGLSVDSLRYRMRNFKGKIELLKVRGELHHFKTPLYKRKDVWRAIHAFNRKKRALPKDTLKVYVTAKEAAQLLGFANANSFVGWKNKCERKPDVAHRWTTHTSGMCRFVVVYELESLYECRNWFLQRKRSADRLPSLSDTRSWSYDARRAGAAVWEHLGYSRAEYLN